MRSSEGRTVSEQTIQSQDINVAEVFQAFYTVPDYQREYVWETGQVEQFLGDINGELADNDAANAPEYFIGSIVVCPGDNSVLELIDGQQRMTTLFLVLCAIRDGIKELGEEPPDSLRPRIAATSTDAYGRDQFRYRLDLQYEDSGGVLERIAEHELDDLGNRSTRSVANIMNAYSVARQFFAHEFGNDIDNLRVFYGYLVNKVKLIRIETQDVAKALKVFETINDRGVGLDSMDLLKNLLFMKASRGDFERLKDYWKDLQDAIFEMGERPLRFLRYFIFSRYDVEILREDEIYAWFSKNEEICGYSADPIAFAIELHRSAQAYGYFRAGKDQHGTKNPHLENLQLLGGQGARQHLILLLSGRHLPAALFNRLAQEVEDLFFVYVIAREPTRAFERNFANWAKEVRKIATADHLETFVSNRFAPAKADLSTRFDDAFENLYDWSVQRYRLRYVLAKLTQHIDRRAYGETEGTSWLSRYTGSGFEIEHILPQQPSAAAATEFGDADDPYIANRLGNLVLVEKSINASLGNRPYSEKRNVYLQSQLLLTKALAERPKVGVQTRIDRAVADIHPFGEWNEAALKERQSQLRALARTVWGVREAS